MRNIFEKKNQNTRCSQPEQYERNTFRLSRVLYPRYGHYIGIL